MCKKSIPKVRDQQYIALLCVVPISKPKMSQNDVFRNCFQQQS